MVRSEFWPVLILLAVSSSESCTEFDTDFYQSPWEGTPLVTQISEKEVLVSWKRALPEGGAASLSCPIDNFYVEYWPRGQLGTRQMRTTPYPSTTVEAAGIAVDKDRESNGIEERTFNFRVVAIRKFLTFETDEVRFTVSKAPSRAALDSIAIVATLLLSSCFLTRLAE